jgi:hypothetical protein
MAQGLDELVEWLVGEVSFFGDGESSASPLSVMVLHASYTHRIPSTRVFYVGNHGTF